MPFLRSVIAHKSSKRGKSTALTDRVVASKDVCFRKLINEHIKIYYYIKLNLM
jgi:hypothetical protein